MHETYGKDGLVILTVTLDSPRDATARADVEKFLAKKVPPFRTLNLDADPEKLPGALNFSDGVPRVFVFNRAGQHVKKLPRVDKDGQEVESVEYDAIEKTVAAEIKKK